MDRNQNYNSQTPLNRSFQPGHIRKSGFDPLSAEEPVASRPCLKWLFLLALMFVTAFLTFGKLNFEVRKFWKDQPKSQFSQQKNQETASEQEGQVHTKTFRFSCSDLERLKQLLDEQSFSVKDTLPVLPTLTSQQAAASKTASNASEREKALKELSLVKFEEVFESFNQLLPFSKIYATTPKEELSRPEKEISRLRDKLKPAEEFQNAEHIKSFALATSDFLGSYESLLSKRDRLNKYRGYLIEAVAILPECQSKREALQSKLEGFDSEAKKLKESIEEDQGQVAAEKANLQTLNEQFKGAEDRASAEIRGVQTKISDLRSKRVNKHLIEAEVGQKESAISANSAKIEALKADSARLKKSSDDFKSQLAANLSRVEDERTKLTALETKHQMNEFFLELHYRNKSIKDFLQKLVDTSDKTASEFQRLLHEKVEEQDSIKTYVDEFYKNIKTLEASEGGSGGSDIDRLIEKDRAELEDVMAKYSAIMKMIKEYKNTDLKIQILLKRQEELKGEIKASKAVIGRLVNENKNLSQKVAEIENQIDRNNKKAEALQSDSKSLGEETTELKSGLQNLEKHLTEAERELARKQESFKVG